MASRSIPSSLLPAALLLLTLYSFASPARSFPDGIRTHMTHIDSGAANLTKLELLRRSLVRSERRIARFTSMSSLASAALTPSAAAAPAAYEATVPVHAGEGEFLMDLSIGTPGLLFPAIVDTGSDLIWTQCKPCEDCYEQPTPVFDPSSSSSFSKLPCSDALCKALPSSDCEHKECVYTYSYGDNSMTKGVLASETFTLGPDNISAANVGFGCGRANSGVGFKQASGLVGLGRGPLSLVAQLGFTKFSYCLTEYGESKESPLLLGSLATLNETETSEVKTTPLVHNPSIPTFYYLSLKGITVGSEILSIPETTFSLGADGNGGFIIDSGTSITYLESNGYEQLKKAFLTKVKLPVADGTDVGLDLCFKAPKSNAERAELPKLIFHFEGADLDLPVENYMIQDAKTGLLCLAITKSSGMSILGNFQQQNMQVLYDLENEKLSFVPAQCGQL